MILDLLEPRHHAGLIDAGRARHANAADHIVADLDRHATRNRDDVGERRLLAAHGLGCHALHEFGRRHAKCHRRVRLAARVLHRVRTGVIGAERHDRIAAAIDHDGGDRVTPGLAVLKRSFGDGFGD